MELTTSNLKRLWKRPRAPKWVRELCNVLPGKVENWEQSFEERCNGDMILEVWRIILSIDKARRSWLKQKSKEERQRRKKKASLGGRKVGDFSATPGSQKVGGFLATLGGQKVGGFWAAPGRRTVVGFSTALGEGTIWIHGIWSDALN